MCARPRQRFLVRPKLASGGVRREDASNENEPERNGNVPTVVESPAAVGMNAKRLERIRPAMQSYVDRGIYAGISTLIARRGKVVHAEQFGWRDKEAGSPMAADAIFRLYSMTKPIVCTALMTLFEEGKFRLVDPVAKYIPAFAASKVMQPDGSLVDAARPITIRDVMTHTSGLTYHFVEDSEVGKMYARGKLLDPQVSLEAAIDELAAMPLAFQPGTKWRYSVGIDVAGRLAEVIGGRPLRDVLRERLFEPLQMRDTAFDVPAAKRDRLSAMYGRPDLIGESDTLPAIFEMWRKGVNERVDVEASYPVDAAHVFARGGHGLYGTTDDYYRFAQMLANGGSLDGVRVIGRKTLELMHANYIPASMLPIEIGGAPLGGYGFGLGSRVALDVAQTGAPGSVGEFGWSGAAKTHYWVDPREQMVGVFMTQSMMSFDLPELDLRALAYQAIED
jgi:CubicO group peptidase (beta-lactamase class C family)